MANEESKDFNAMLHDSKDMPKSSYPFPHGPVFKETDKTKRLIGEP